MDCFIPAGDKKKCTGCGLCVQKCPRKCIQMQRDEEGFFYPEVNVNMAQCVQCGLCEKACQSLIGSSMYHSRSEAFFCMASNERHELLQSSSGGVFSLIAKGFIQQGGYVCGCVYDKTMRAVHILTDREEELCKMRGSKYVQSSLDDVYSAIREALHNNRKVLFTGTGCQVAAVRAFVGEHLKDNLYTMEILCHGVPSPGFFEQYVQYLERKHQGKVVDIQFRNKEKDGWGSEHKTCIILQDKNGGIMKIRPMLPSYFSAFFYGMNLRESCYACNYARGERVADLTLGDFWGAWKKYGADFHDGISVVAVNSEKGHQLCRGIEKKASHFERLQEKEAMHGNGNFYAPVVRPVDRNTFYRDKESGGYAKVWKRVYLSKTYRKKVIKSIYGAIVPKKLRMIRQSLRMKINR